MIRFATLALLVLAACGGRVDGDSDAATDGGGADGSKSDAGSSSSGDVTCGPNVCRTGEICCNAKCGVCAFPSECVDHGCGG